jgi:hypothetical protein
VFVLAAFSMNAIAQDAPAAMPGMENSLGVLSSGTGVEPRNSTAVNPMVHRALGSWMLMFHGNAFLVSSQQSGPRGADKVFSANWIMPMLTRRSGRHTVTARTMLSLEPLTVTKRQYPLLFQTGETAFGSWIVDGQHPHELVMELAGRYEFSFGERAGVFIYGGPRGEPAIGPPAFPHRASASENPMAVLSHHFQDSTHIATNLVTAGFNAGPLQIEASTFHGGEPDENRWNFDSGKMDSFTTRLTLAAGPSLTGQFSIGRLNNREALEPELDTLRTTASLHHTVRLGEGHVASSVIWGRNKDVHSPGEEFVFSSYTLESTARFKNANWVWTRIENVDRGLGLIGGSDHEPGRRVQAYTFGYERELPVEKVSLGLGAQLTAYGVPDAFRAAYGDRPVGVQMFLRLRPKGSATAAQDPAMHKH